MNQIEITHDAWLRSMKQLPPRQDIYALLKENDGIVFDTTQQCWLVSDPALIRHLLSSHAVLSSPGTNSDTSVSDQDLREVLALLSRQILFQDGEEHERLKALMVQPLQWHIHHLQPEIGQRIELLLEGVSQLTEWDLVMDFALPLACWVMARLIGLTEQPPERVLNWGKSLADVTSGKFSRLRTLQQVLEMHGVCLYIAQERRLSPQDDLISSFVFQSGWKSDEELVDNAMTIFGAGISTIPKAIAHSSLFFHAYYPGWEESKGQDLVEHLLCHTTPTRFITRWMGEPLSIGTHRIEAHQQIYLLLEAANGEVSSTGGTDCKKHLSFGLPTNPHYCLGASLARSVLQHAISRLFARFPGLVLIEQGPWGENPNLSGITSMIVTTGEK